MQTSFKLGQVLDFFDQATGFENNGFGGNNVALKPTVD